MKNLFRALVVAAVLLVSGCASVPMADSSADTAAKAFTAPAGRSRIYVYRNETLGAALTMDVFVNGRRLGQTGARTYLVADVPPGAHKILGKAENESMVELSTVAGRTYFVWQEVKMGLMSGRNLLQVVDEKTGRAGVLESNLAAEAK
jgi:hypothetical protein